MKHKTLLITLLMLTATPAFAQIPLTMSYQGVLTDAAGNAVAAGQVEGQHRLFDGGLVLVVRFVLFVSHIFIKPCVGP